LTKNPGLTTLLYKFSHGKAPCTLLDQHPFQTDEPSPLSTFPQYQLSMTAGGFSNHLVEMGTCTEYQLNEAHRPNEQSHRTLGGKLRRLLRHTTKSRNRDI
jgi:hypothetical protein